MKAPKVTLADYYDRLNSVGLHNEFTWNAAWYVLSEFNHNRENGYSYCEGHFFPVTLHVIDYFKQFNIPLRQEVIAASLLHDTLEDKLGDQAFIEKFGQDVYNLVQPVTFPEISKEATDFSVRKKVYYLQLRSAPLESKVIKLADV